MHRLFFDCVFSWEEGSHSPEALLFLRPLPPPRNKDAYGDKEPGEGRSKRLHSSRAREVSVPGAEGTTGLRKAKVASKQVAPARPTPRPARPPPALSFRPPPQRHPPAPTFWGEGFGGAEVHRLRRPESRQDGWRSCENTLLPKLGSECRGWGARKSSRREREAPQAPRPDAEWGRAQHPRVPKAPLCRHSEPAAAPG